MAKRPYEISLWSHSDILLAVLLTSDTSMPGGGYDPRWYDGLNGEKKLTFTIPIKYFVEDTGEFINNEKWYNELKTSHSLANEKKIKLIFDKFKAGPSPNTWGHEIHELIIEGLSETRSGLELFCEVTCVGAPFKELGKTGTELTLNIETVLLEQEKTEEIIDPTINYWLDKVFPAPLAGAITPSWTYRIALNNIMGMPSNRVYETEHISDWQKVEGELKPIYTPEPVEKVRFVEVQDSNKYNITQSIAETFQVFVDYKYYYDDYDNPFKITRKEVLFFDAPNYAGEYSIVYGNNQLGLTRTSDSTDVTTKMFATPIESEYSDTGYVTIADADSNKTCDNFILDFNYFIESGQLTEGQKEAIPIFEEAIRDLNIIIDKRANELGNYDYIISMLEADIGNQENRYNAANDNVINIEDKMLAFDTALPTYVLSDKDVLNTAKGEGAYTSLKLRRSGVLKTGITAKKTNGVQVPIVTSRSTYDNYGYVLTISFNSSTVPDGTLLKLTYNYDLLAFYRKELATFMAIRSSAQYRKDQKEAELAIVTQERDGAKNLLESQQESKQRLIREFNDTMAPFLKEGVWSDSNYKPAFESHIVDPITITYDPFAIYGEDTAQYMSGLIETGYHYIQPTMPIDATTIEELVIMEHYIDQLGNETSRELRYGAQWLPQFIYKKKVSPDITYDTLELLIAQNPTSSLAYFVKREGKVYQKISADWVQMTPVLAFVFDKETQLNAPNRTFRINDVAVAPSNIHVGTDYTIAHRRWFLTENGEYSGAPLKNIQTASMILKRSEFVLEPFADYNVLVHEGGQLKSVTFKINNNVTYNTTAFSAGFKLDVSAKSFLNDAMNVSKTSAYPEVSYEVSLAYIKDADFFPPTQDANTDKTIRCGDIVRITDHDLQLKSVKGIITAIEFNLNRSEDTTITVQNYKTKFEDLFERIVASTEQMRTSGYLYDRIAGVFGPNLQLSGRVLQDSIDNAMISFTSGAKSNVTWGQGGVLTETTNAYPNGVTGMTWISGGNILISNGIDENGNRIWSTAVTPAGISASAIQTGRLDTSLINIYSGGQMRFTWRADGLFAFKPSETDLAGMFTTYVRYSEDGLIFMEKGQRTMELGWDGLYIGSQNGSVELSGGGGLEVYNQAVPRQLLIKLGGFGVQNMAGIYPEYGMRFYKHVQGEAIETLVSTNNGQLWLRDSLHVGTAGGFVGITGAGAPTAEHDPIRIWAGAEAPISAPFSVTNAGFLKASSGVVGGFSLTDKTLFYGDGVNNFVGLGQDGDYRIWAGAPSQANAPFSVTKGGHLTATSGQINGPFSVDGYLSSTYFASGAFGNGWRISGSGSAEFNDVYVRGTIAASVFEYQTISSVGGSLYVAPAIISFINSNQIAIVTNKYVITIPENFTNPQRGGHTWVVGDYVSLSGFIAKNNTSYELKDIRARVGSISGSGISLITLSDAGDIVCYDENDNAVNYTSLSMAGATLMKRATIVLLGTYQDETAYNRGILINAVGNDTPFIDVYDDQNSTSGNPKVRLGNLGGIIDPNFGPGALSGYGLYAENAYLTGKIVATSGYIGGPDGWTIAEGAMYNGGRFSILQNTTGVYFGKDGFGLGGGLLYKTETNELIISGDSITMGIGLISPVPLPEYIDSQLGYRLEVLSTSNILSSDITEITIYTRVYKGQADITEDLPDSVFHWERVSNDAFADSIWNNDPANQGRKTFTLSTLDVYYSATFTCSIVE